MIKTEHKQKDLPKGGNTESTESPRTEQTGHTPGPWKFIPNEQLPMLREIQSDQKIGICHVYHLHNQNWEANVRLITAAPELLEALKDAPCTCPNPDGSYPHDIYWSDCYRNQVANLIAKAEGK